MACKGGQGNWWRGHDQQSPGERRSTCVPLCKRIGPQLSAGDLAVWQGDYRHATTRLEQSLVRARAAGEVGLAVDALIQIASP